VRWGDSCGGRPPGSTPRCAEADAAPAIGASRKPTRPRLLSTSEPRRAVGNYTTRAESTDGGRVHVSSYATDRADQSRRLVGLIVGVRGCLVYGAEVPELN
jgi:hypothetical protein